MSADVFIRSLALGKEDRNNVRNKQNHQHDAGALYKGELI